MKFWFDIFFVIVRVHGCRVTVTAGELLHDFWVLGALVTFMADFSAVVTNYSGLFLGYLVCLGELEGGAVGNY